MGGGIEKKRKKKENKKWNNEIQNNEFTWRYYT